MSRIAKKRVSKIGAILLIFAIMGVAIPTIKSCINIFISLLEMYPNLEINAQFFGGFIFLFILYKIFESLCYIISMLLNFITNLK